MLLLALLLLDPGRIETVASTDFSRDLQVAVTLATVQVINRQNDKDGSGVILRHQKPFTYVLTARHVVGDAEQVELRVFSPQSYPAPALVVAAVEVVARAKDADLALLRFAPREPVSPAVRLCPRDEAPAGKGFQVLLTGCGSGDAPAGQIGDVTGTKRVRHPATGALSLVWELSVEPKQGVSGGPVVDRRGLVVGICSGTNSGKGYCCHLQEIHDFLKQNGFRWLSERPHD